MAQDPGTTHRTTKRCQPGRLERQDTQVGDSLTMAYGCFQCTSKAIPIIWDEKREFATMDEPCRSCQEDFHAEHGTNFIDRREQKKTKKAAGAA